MPICALNLVACNKNCTVRIKHILGGKAFAERKGGRNRALRRPCIEISEDLYRVNFEVQQLKPFVCLAFPFLNSMKTSQSGLVLVTNW